MPKFLSDFLPKEFSANQFKIILLLLGLAYLASSQNAATSSVNLSSDAQRLNRAVEFQLAAVPTGNGSGRSTERCPVAQRRVRVNADAVLNLRSYPDGPVLDTLEPGTIVMAQRNDSTGKWVEVATPEGQFGWAFEAYLGCG